MEEVVFSQLDEPSHYVLDQLQHVPFAQTFTPLEQSAEVALVAELGNDEAVGLLLDHIVAGEDVVVFEFSQGLDLAI
jgi:ureidoglycolate hydrolase